MSSPAGLASRSTFADSDRTPHELQRIKPPINSDAIGSAIVYPVNKTTMPATTTPKDEAASPSM